MDKSLETKVIEHRRALHSIPEIEFDLTKTRRYIIGVLSDLGYKTEIVGRGSVVAFTGNGNRILLRADMDALKIEEATKLPFSSENGCMHACGHDMHAAMLLGAAEILAKSEDKGVGVVLLFQAAEESLCGAKDVIESGLIGRLNITSAFTVHVLTNAPAKTGSLIIPFGTVAPGADVIRITVVGKNAHGSTPHMGVNSIHCAIDIINRIDRFLLNRLPPTSMRAINWGLIDGGTAANVVPERTVISGNVRCFDKTVRDKIIDAVHNISNELSSSCGCTSEVEIIGGCPPLENNGKLSYYISNELSKAGFNVIDFNSLNRVDSSLGGSDDFAHYGKQVPSVMISICAGRAEDGYTSPLHTPKTNFDEEALSVGARLFAKIPSIMKKHSPN